MTGLPQGHTKTKGGVIAKTDTLVAIERQRLERTLTKTGSRKRSRTAAKVTQDATMPWQLTGMADAGKRGTDPSGDNNRAAFLETLETIKDRDPILTRTIDYYDQLAIGDGLGVKSDDELVDKAANRIWTDNDLDDLQHRMAHELAATGALTIRVPLNNPLDILENRVRIPTIELLPSTQIKRIATDEYGQPSYYFRQWKRAKYRDMVPGVNVGTRSIAPSYETVSEDIPADQIVHVTIGEGAKGLRGKAVIETSARWSTLYGRSLESTYMLAQSRAMIAWQAKVANSGGDGANDPEVLALRNYLDDQLVDRMDASGLTYTTVPTGQIMATGDNVEFVPLSPGATGGSLDAELRRILLMSIVGPGMPEVFVSDGSYANLASAETQSNPFFKLMRSFQRAIVRAMRKTLKLCFDRLIEAGLFDNASSDDPMSRLEHPIDRLEITAPEVLTPNIATLGPVVGALVAQRVIDRESASELLGLDWEKISKGLKSDRDKGFEPSQPVGAITLPFNKPGVDSDGNATNETYGSVTFGEEPRHEETESPQTTAARDIKGELAAFLQKALTSKDPATINQAYNDWLEAAQQRMTELIDSTRELGQETVEAA